MHVFKRLGDMPMENAAIAAASTTVVQFTNHLARSKRRATGMSIQLRIS